MDILFALALTVSQIKTGNDLLAACEAPDTKACDAFIDHVLNTDPEYGCARGPFDIPMARNSFLEQARKLTTAERTIPAAEFFTLVDGPDCSAD